MSVIFHFSTNADNDIVYDIRQCLNLLYGVFMSKIDSLQQCFDMMPARFLPEQAAGENAVIQFDLTGDQAGQWYLVIQNGQLNSITEGKHDSADMQMSMPGDAWLAIANGDTNAMALFMQGKIRISGDMGMAMKMQKWFKLSGQ